MKPILCHAVVPVALFLGFRHLFGGWTTSRHQRLTMTVETPAGGVSGSSVTKVRVVDTLIAARTTFIA